MVILLNLNIKIYILKYFNVRMELMRVIWVSAVNINRRIPTYTKRLN